MQNIQKPALAVFPVLVAALAFYGVLPFWWSLSSGQIWDPDLVRPIAYFFAALFGILYLLRLGRDGQRSASERALCRVAIISILAAPVLYYVVSAIPLAGDVLYVLEWIIAILLVASLANFVARDRLSLLQKAGVIASILAALIAPFMPWWSTLLDTGSVPQNLYGLLWRYGLWLVAGIWCAAAWLALRTELHSPDGSGAFASRRTVLPPPMRRGLFTGLVIGLGVMMVGMYNPVGYSSAAYEQSTYIGGQLVDQSIVSIPNLNVTLLLGMGILIFSLLILFLDSPAREK